MTSVVQLNETIGELRKRLVEVNSLIVSLERIGKPREAPARARRGRPRKIAERPRT